MTVRGGRRNIDRVVLHSALVIEPVADGEWVLRELFQAKDFFTTPAAEWIIVPAGFLTDLASVPRLPGMYLLFGGKARKSAVVHDYLLAPAVTASSRTRCSWRPCGMRRTRSRVA